MKKRMKRIAAYLMATVMMLSCVMVEGTTVKAEEAYVVNPADYDIEYLLSNYQVYLEGDLTTTNTGHQVGALIVGGNAALGNSFGNVTIAPSYINHIEVFGQTNGYYTEIEQAYGDALTDVVYYSSKADSAYLTTQPKSFSKIPENSYIDFDAAYNAIKAESTSKANNAGTTIDVSDVDADGYIYLDVSPTTKPRTYKITEEAFKKAAGIRFTGTNGSADVFRNTDTDTITGITGNPVEISVVGCDGTDEDITLNFNGSGTADSYSVGVEMDDGSGGYMAMGSKLKDKITGANDVQSGQVFAKGMSLIWNFPDAKNITSYFTSGHMVAPNAHVAVEGGNFEGGVIAASAYLNSEGHFYPYYEIGTATTSAPMEDMKVTKYVKKIWNEENDTYNNRPASVTVHLYQDGVLVENSARELSQQNNWQDQWLNLDPNHEYTVVEDPVPGYTCEVVEDGGTFEVINTPETTSMTATKIWKNDGYDYNNTRQEVKAILLANGASINGVEAATLNAENNWSYTWDNLPTYKDKQKITYNVNETQIPPGYTHKETNQVDDTHLVFVNEYYTNIQPQGETTTLTVEKKWENYGNTQPESTTVFLVANDTISDPIELNVGNNWTYTWDNLPTKDKNDNNIIYSAKEVAVPNNYTATYSQVVDNKITITNTYTPVTSKTVKKIWNDGDSAVRPTSVNVQVYADGVPFGDAVALTSSNNWEYTWTDLPELKKNSAEKVVYTVKEVAVPDGYDCTTETVGDTVTLINTLKATEPTPVPQTGSITLTGTKVVEGTGAPSETYNFVVTENGVEVATGTANGAGAITFTEIKYDESNIGEHTYKVTETAGQNANMEYDNATITVVVNVAKGTDALTATVTSAETIKFKNTYTDPVNPTPATADATFSKKAVSADGEELAGAKITLTYNDGSNDLSGVTHVSGGKNVATATDKNSISWTSTTTPVKLSGLPEGEYTMTETGAPNGYKYATAISFKVDADGKIYQRKADDTYETTPTTTLTMVDAAKAGEITLLGIKNITGDTVPSETYNFVVKEGNNQVATGSATGAEPITFTKITYGPKDLGEHTYTITETQGTTDGMTYDTSSKTVKVTVSDDGSDTLKAIVNVVGSDDIEFTNTYDDPTPSTADAIFSKKAVSADGDELAGAQIKLTYDSGSNNLSGVTCISGGEDVIIGATAITWTSTTTAVKLSGLPEGEYTMTETGAPDGYKYATAISFKVDADGKIYQKKADDTYETTPTTTLTMVDEAKAGEITLEGTKVLEGDIAPSEKYEFVVQEGDVQVATGEADGAGDITFTKITYGPEDIGPHTYKITETSGYTSGMDYDNTTKTVVVTVSDDGTDALKAVVTSGEGTVVFTNTYTEPIPPLTAIGSFSKKAVSADGNELAGAQIKLTYDSGSYNLSGVTCLSGGDNVTIGATAITWTSTTTAVKLSGLPEGEYTMTETGAPAGYKYATAVSFRVGVDGKIYQKKADGTYETTTTHILTMVDEAKAGEITLTGKKTLAGDVAPSETYKFVVKEGDAQVATGEVDGAGDITFTKIVYGPENIGEHTYTITEIKGSTEGMTYDSTSKTVKVTVSDGGEDELEVTVDPVSSDAITFTNTYDNPTPDTATVTFSKTDAANTGELSGAKITLSTTDDIDLSNVTGSGTLDSKSEKSVTWTSGSSAMVLSGLPAGKYTMKETGAPLGYQYASDITFTITDEGKVKDANGNELTDNKITMVDEAIAKITKTVTKVWDDNNDAASKRPISIQVQLKANGNDKGTTVTLDGSNSWSYTWTNLDKTDAQGTLIEYTVDEVSVPADYSKSVATDNDGNVTIINTYSATTPKAGSIYLPGTKVVEGTGAPSETYQFVVKEGTKQVATGSISGAGKFTFSKIEYGPTDIGEHTYTITETAGNTEGMTYDSTEITVKVTVTETQNALSATITSGEDAIKFTNKYTAPTPTVTTVDKTIKKVWADVNDTDKIRPESVELAILADGVKTGKTVTLNASNNWEAKVEKLPTTNSSGTAIVYTIEETSVPAGYTVTYSTSGDVLTATNTHAPTSKDAPATGGLKITVVDEKTNDPVPGATVQVKYPDGTVETVKTDEKGQITYPQEPGIPTGDYEITVTEVPDGYTVTTGETGKATVVEDKVAEHIAKIKTSTGGLKITVVDEKTNDPVPGATVQIKYPDGTVETKTTDDNGEINYPQDPGVPTGDYEITVTEVPDGYTVTIGKTAKVTVEKNTVAEHIAKVDSAEDSTSEEEEEEEDSDEDSDEITDDDSNEEQDSDATAKTGDNSPVKPVAVAMLLALALFAVLFFIRRKNA